MVFINRHLLLGLSGIIVVMISVFTTVFTTNHFQKNNAPVVTFVTPHDSSQFAINTVVPYKIMVSDKEDGESKFDEIPSTEVFLEVRYFTDPAKALSFKQSPFKKDPDGLAILKKQDCFTCHALWNKVIGPSFNEISGRYKLSDTALLATHVVNGSTGRWGSTVMPTHPDLSLKEARLIVYWILENSSSPNVDYIRGAEGSVRIQPQKNMANGSIVLQASYTDHGAGNNPASSITGYDRALIRIK